MNLLLLLSALLSALTGAASGVREPAAAHAARSAIVAVTEASAATVLAAARPVQSLPSLAVASMAPGIAVAVQTLAVPLYANCRRE